MFDGEAFGTEIVSAVKSYVDGVVAPLLAENAALLKRVGELEARQTERGEPGADGRDGADGQPGRDGVDGKDAEPVTDERLAEIVAAHLAANPPADGKDGRDGVDGKDGSPGLDGKDGSPGLSGKDGADGIHGKDGRDGIDGKDGAAAPLIAHAFKDHTGELIVTLTDGTVLRTGIFDGVNGRDGAPGNDGRDGLCPDKIIQAWGDDGRTLTTKYVYGDTAIVVEAEGEPAPFVVERGVFKDGQGYQKGDGVTWGGSYWIAQKDTHAKPTEGPDWRLAIRKGRDGKDGKDGDRGPPGKDGKPDGRG
jgi:hypothetical protein